MSSNARAGEFSHSPEAESKFSTLYWTSFKVIDGYGKADVATCTRAVRQWRSYLKSVRTPSTRHLVGSGGNRSMRSCSPGAKYKSAQMRLLVELVSPSIAMSAMNGMAMGLGAR